MTDLIAPDLDACLLEGRRAAWAEITRIALANGGNYTGPSPEQMVAATSDISISGVRITSAIDAAILETVARVQRPASRPWWRFWR